MRREELYLADLVDNARAVREYLDGVSRERWDADRRRASGRLAGPVPGRGVAAGPGVP
jgi:hypothetical protein